MAPTIKWQRFDTASYDWFGTTATDALPQIEAELNAWIATVNANPSNAGRQITKMRGYADSTTTNYAGITLRYGANNNTAYAYSFFGCRGSISNRAWYLGTTYADDTSNGGYGTISNGTSDTSISFLTSGYDADFMLTYDTTDGQEYFLFGPRFSNDSVSYQDGFSIIKSTTGEWLFESGDGNANRLVFHYFDDAVSTGWSAVNRTTNGTSKMVPENESFSRYYLAAQNSGSPSPTSFSGNVKVVAANPSLLQPQNNSYYFKTGTRRILTDISANNDFFLLASYYYGPTVLVDLRP